VPVVSVGNLTMGGTGKTPMVRWLAEWFQRRGVRVGLLSRGYGAEQGSPNDEALELAFYLPDVPHLQQRDRVLAARRLARQRDCQLLLLDDGFQHRRLHRDLDIVLLDALQPFGFEHVFPRGTLREPPCGLARARIVVLSRSDLAGEEQRATVRRRVAHLASQADWAEIAHRPSDLLAADGAREPLEAWSGRPVAAFCGVGNPAGFQQTLQRAGFEVRRFRAYPDHHGYAPPELASLGHWARQATGLAAVLCTHKDLVKIGRRELGGLPLRAMAIEVLPQEGLAVLEKHLEQIRTTAVAQSTPGGNAEGDGR
jgi:tetraacyldisaccharide 4'-kinase